MADSHLQPGFWDNLLDYIEDRTVVPVVGAQLVTVREGDRDVPLYRWVARRLAADLDLPAPELPERFDLNDVVSMHLRRRGEREELYARIQRLLRHATLAPSEPLRLFDELRGNHLLILGCSFGDWLARFFLRTARNLELSQKRRRWDVLVGDDRIAHDPELALFLESFSPDTRVVPLTAARFVAELAERWHAAHPAPGAKPMDQEAGPGGRKIPMGAIFVSYASEDLETAGRLAEGLRAAGLEVWLDKNALQPAEDWARGIRRAIERCSLFLPVISRRALGEGNRRRYLWREWNDADDFARGMAPDEAFIVPVMIDDTRIDRAPLPNSFQRAQGVTLPGGEITADVAGRLLELVRDFHRRQRAA